MTKAERTRQFIIEQSAPLFNTKGVAGTAMSDIMEATKMAKGGLYGHFESKDELSNAVVDYCLTTVGDKVKLAINKQKTAKGKLFAFLDLMNDFENPPLKGGCPMINFGMEADDTNNVVNLKVKDGIDWSISLISTIITDGINAGEFKSTLNAGDFAVKLFATLEGATIIARVTRNNVRMDTVIKMLKKEIEEQVI
jgi:TetR/AcrR family transcriptional repressor of nem operon